MKEREELWPMDAKVLHRWRNQINGQKTVGNVE
jgi:hypothetical protein